LLLPSYLDKPSSVLYKHFIMCIKCIYLQNKYLVSPYAVGKDKKSLAMVLPVEVVKALEINPQSIFLLLEVKGRDILQLQIIRESDLAKKEVDTIRPVDNRVVPRDQQVACASSSR
jgi:hypothetical protein